MDCSQLFSIICLDSFLEDKVIHSQLICEYPANLFIFPEVDG